MEDVSPAGLALSPRQMRLASYLEPSCAVEPYVAQIAIEIQGAIDHGRLIRALEAVIARHEILRTRFIRRTGLTVPLQDILPEHAVSSGLYTLSVVKVTGSNTPRDHILAAVPDDAFQLEQGRVIYLTISQIAGSSSLLTLATPAICADAVSLETIVRDLATSYAAAHAEMARPTQYADASEYLKDVLSSEFGAVGRQYWHPRIGTANRTRLKRTAVWPVEGRFQPQVVHARIPASWVSQVPLQGGARFSPEVFLLTCWRLLLCRLYGLDRLVVGYAASGRISAELAGCVGPFETYLPLELETGFEKKFGEALLTMMETIQQAAKWQGAFQWPDHDGFHFGAFSYYDANWSFNADGVAFRPAAIRVCSERYCLKLNCTNIGSHILVDLSYDPQVYAEHEADLMVSQFVTLVQSAQTAPEARLCDLNLVNDTERHQLVVACNASGQLIPTMSVEARFEAQVARTCDAIAIIYNDQHLSYWTLNARARALARRLEDIGVALESRVGICLPREPHALVAMLAVLKTGAAYVPVDPTYPSEWLSRALQDAGVKLVLTSTGLRERVSASHSEPLCIDVELEEPLCSGRPANELSASSAYILFTSGSTGRPKGVIVTRQGLSNYVTWACAAYEYGPGKRVPLCSSLAFDLTVTSLWPPLVTGGCVVIVPDDTSAEALLSEEARLFEYSTVKLTPSHLRVLQSASEMRREARIAKRFVIGGEALMWEDLDYWRRQTPATLFVNEYGPTETVVGCCVYETPSEAQLSGSVPIGRPIANTRVYVTNEWGQLAPAGAEGELCVGGAGLGRGYSNQADTTAERFVPDGISGRPGERMYRTGDRVRWGPGWDLEYIGRLDGQIKLRGYRVELGEIEAVLIEHPAVEQSAVILREDEPGVRRLIAYMVGAEEAGTADLRRYLENKLPGHMVPSEVVHLKEMPLTSNGKINRRALPKPKLESRRRYLPPRSAAEQTLCRIWAAILGLEQVGINDNFYELGGDSILSILVIAQAREAGVCLTPKQFLDYHTVAELAEVARVQTVEANEQDVLVGPVDLSPIQRAFFEWQLANPHHFNQTTILKLKPGASSYLLEQAMEALLLHHDVLRLRFEECGSQWLQRYEEPGDGISFIRIDLSYVSEQERNAALHSTATAIQASLRLDEGPLIRAAEYNLGPEGRRLLLVIHHLAIDGVGWRILLQDFERGYKQLAQGDVLQLAPKTTSFRYWADRLRQYARGEELKGETQYWLSREWDQVQSALPRDHVLGENTAGSVRTISSWLSEKETQALLQKVPATSHTQINDVLLAALFSACTRWSGERSLLIELEGHGREHIFEDVDLSRTLGWFTSTFPVCLQVDSDHCGKLLMEIKEQLRAIPAKGLGYGMLRYLSGDSIAQARLRSLPKPEITFNYLGQFDQVFRNSAIFSPASESCGPSQAPANVMQSLLTVKGLVANGRLKIDWSYSKNIHRKATVEKLAADCCQFLRDLIDYCFTEQGVRYTPSDFPDAHLSQERLDSVIARLARESAK